MYDRLFLNVWEMLSKKLYYVISLQDRKVKKTSTSQYQSFEHNGMKIYDQQRLESLEEKKAAHMQTWCQKDLQTL